MTKMILEELDAALDATEFLNSFLDDYNQLECLAHGHGTETYLVQKKGGEKLYIAKCYDRTIYKEIHESAILKTLSHERLPAFADEYQDENTVCIVREYIEGTPLNEYLAGRRLPPAEAISLCAGLCDILTYLHSRKPPVIHRDIKPHNIIVQNNGDVALVDFDIARIYANDADTDTRIIGTRSYAPPEQYGFSQTDCRTDIYSLGVLLCCMLTGHTDVKNVEIGNKRLAAVVRRCAAFAPQQRFSSASAVKKALLRAGGFGIRRPARVGIACILALFVLGMGFVLGRYTDFLAPAAQAQRVHFAEPLVEQAVRAQLGKSNAELLTGEDLQSVRGIYIFGSEVSTTYETFVDGLAGWLGELPRGRITSLEDVALLPNLEVLYVNYQPLSDITPLAQLKNLKYVDLRHTNVSDISPLAGLLKLENVGLFDTTVSSLAPLTECPRLNSLEIGQTLIRSIADIPALPGLTRLSLRDLPLDSLTGIERFTRLNWLCLTGTGVTDLAPLKALNKLTEVFVDESMRNAVEALGNISFSVEYE
jgi:tRNA A-37 threonylcarbamoyl transferase component Bud32